MYAPLERRKPFGFFGARREQPKLTGVQQELILRELKAHREKNPAFWRSMEENLSKKVTALMHQPAEYSVFFTLTSLVPFIDETTAALITDKFSRQVLMSPSGFQAPRPESPEYKQLLKHVAISKALVVQVLRQNPVERNQLAIGIANSTGRLSKPILQSFTLPQRAVLNIARLKGEKALQQKLQHYAALAERRQAGKALPSWRLRYANK